LDAPSKPSSETSLLLASFGSSHLHVCVFAGSSAPHRRSSSVALGTRRGGALCLQLRASAAQRVRGVGSAKSCQRSIGTELGGMGPRVELTRRRREKIDASDVLFSGPDVSRSVGAPLFLAFVPHPARLSSSTVLASEPTGGSFARPRSPQVMRPFSNPRCRLVRTYASMSEQSSPPQAKTIVQPYDVALHSSVSEIDPTDWNSFARTCSPFA
jgi:hypothetical protein